MTKTWGANEGKTTEHEFRARITAKRVTSRTGAEAFDRETGKSAARRYVGSSYRKALVWYEIDGQARVTIGRPGDGPHEFESNLGGEFCKQCGLSVLAHH